MTVPYIFQICNDNANQIILLEDNNPAAFLQKPFNGMPSTIPEQWAGDRLSARQLAAAMIPSAFSQNVVIVWCFSASGCYCRLRFNH